MNIVGNFSSINASVSKSKHAIESFPPLSFTESIEFKFSVTLALLDSLQFGIAMLDISGKIFMVNESAKKISAQTKGFRITPNYRLVFRSSNLRKGQTLRNKFNRGELDLGDITDRRLIVVKKPSSSSNIIFKLIPIQEFTGSSDANKSGTLVLIVDPDRSQSVSVKAFSKLFNLTATEHKIVHLLTNGLNLNMISEERNTTISTVRKQIKAIFLKTGSSSQLELVRRAMGLSTPFKTY